MSMLFSQFNMLALNLKNRIVIAPMCQYSADNGNATDWHLIHLGKLSLSGAGLLIIEATAVCPRARISPDDLGMWSDSNMTALDKVLTSIRLYSQMPIAIQLAHAGRKASINSPWKGGKKIAIENGGWQTLAPSDLPFNSTDPVPHALNSQDMTEIVKSFVAAAKRSEKLGLDAIELHCAHGYLLHEFLSPLANKRSDQYGGSLENRMRFPLQIFKAIIDAVTIPVGVRISATDWAIGGWDIEQSVEYAHKLKELGCAYIHVSSGGLVPEQQITPVPGYQVPFAKQIKEKVNIPVIAAGLITEAIQAEAIISAGDSDMVSLAREILRQPNWPLLAAAKLGVSVKAPPQYWILST